MPSKNFHDGKKVDFWDVYSTSFVWREVKPLGAITHGLRHCYVRKTKTAAQFVCLYAGIPSHSGDHHAHLFTCSLEFRRTLKIIARILRALYVKW